MPSIKKYSLLKWILIVLLPLNLFSYLLLKELHQSSIHAAFHSNKEHKDLLTLCFSQKTLLTIDWIEAHEFVLDQTWYDVVDKKTYDDGSISFLVYKDTKEKQMLAHLFDSDHSSNSNSNSSTLHYEIYLYLPSEITTSLRQFHIVSYNLKQEIYGSLTKFVLKPPPRLKKSFINLV